jgi:hypothetical protein
MEHMFKKFLALTALAACLGGFADVTAMVTANNNNIGRVTPKFTIRSQGTNALRRLVGVWDKMNLYDECDWNAFFSIMPEYTRSFNNGRIAECLFGTDDCNNDCSSFRVQGPNVADRDPLAWWAPYFGLPFDYSSVVTVKPRIQNFLVDFFGYVGLDNCYEGLYAWIQFPVTWTKWTLDFCERVLDAGSADNISIPGGFISPDNIDRAELQPTFQAFMRGNAIDPIVQGDTTITFDPLTCGRICGDDTLTRVSEVRFAVGYNFLLCEDYHFGLNLQASGPSGNKVKSCFLFAPQNGNDHHWELGVGIDAHAILWRCEDEDSHFGFYVDANITHMFKSKETRCFDLCGKPLSRYMTAARMTTPNDPTAATPGIIAADDAGAFPTTVFSGELSPVANITTFNVDVTVSVNADVVAMFNYTCGNWTWDLGYNFWGRSCEKIKLDCECPQTNFAENTWVLQGDAALFGCTAADVSHALSASETGQATAQITGGSNLARGPVTEPQLLAALGNPNIDNPQLAFFGDATTSEALFSCSDLTTPISTSIQPIFISQTDINFAKTQGLSHKIFSHFGYNWDCECWSPFLGIGFEAEFAQHNNDRCNNDCNSDCKTSCNDNCDNDLQGDCVRCGLSQWGIWIKGGVAFN